MATTRKTKPKEAVPRPGGRSARVVRDVLAAAIDVFAERGYAGLSFEEVAVRAGVNKTTVYRRWATKSDLFKAALIELRENNEVPDTGSLRADLLAILERFVKKLSLPRGRTVARAILIGASEPELAAIVSDLRREQPAIPTVIFDRAIERGELPKHVDRMLLAEALMGPIQSRLLWKGLETSPTWIASLFDLCLHGVTRR